jgi:hypothetical protein
MACDIDLEQQRSLNWVYFGGRRQMLLKESGNFFQQFVFPIYE